MINVLKKYAEKIDSSAIVITGELSESRKAMGWEDGGKLFDNHIILSDKEWSFKGEAIIDQYNDRMHVFNGITYTPRMRHLIEYAIARNVAYCNMSEAYFNLEKGWKRILKPSSWQQYCHSRPERLRQTVMASFAFLEGVRGMLPSSSALDLRIFIHLVILQMNPLKYR